MTRPPKTLFWSTLLILAVVTTAVWIFSERQLPDSIAINVEGQPTIGYPKARVHIVVFEEPKCDNCKEYSDTILPRIKKEYIDTNKVLYTTVPVAFLPGSMPAAIGLWCVYMADPDYPDDEAFYEYLDYIYAHQPDEQTDWVTTEKMLEMAKESSPAIDLPKLKKCIDARSYRTVIEKNTKYGAKLMGGEISTPTVYVNGMEVKELSYDHLSRLINAALEEEGVH